MEFEREASNELKSKRLNSLMKLLEACDEFGKAWETAFPAFEREKHMSYLECLSELNNLSELVPPSLAFCLAAILANEVEKTMAHLAERVTLED